MGGFTLLRLTVVAATFEVDPVMFVAVMLSLNVLGASHVICCIPFLHAVANEGHVERDPDRRVYVSSFVGNGPAGGCCSCKKQANIKVAGMPVDYYRLRVAWGINS